MPQFHWFSVTDQHGDALGRKKTHLDLFIIAAVEQNAVHPGCDRPLWFAGTSGQSRQRSQEDFAKWGAVAQKTGLQLD